MDPTEMLTLARRSLMGATERTAELLAAAPDSSVLAQRCEWSLREVAAHLITGAPMFADMANGIPGPATSLEPGYVKVFCERRIADLPEADPVKLSRLLLDAVEGFLDTTIDRPGDDPVTFQAGLSHTLFGLVGIYLGEVLLHGYDMAAALGRPWPIDPGEASLVLAAYTPLFAVRAHPERTRGLTAAFGIELRGAGAMTARFTDGAFGVEPAGGAVDATLSADPVAFLMVGSGRLSRYEAVALGGLAVGGNRPDLAFDFPTLFVYA
ncbi:MAG: maleylpyruvate isomerase family mycothiol-dependent enzyme [Acidimicrobiia bacterium]